MLRIIRNNSPYTVIILFIFTLLAKLQALSHPVAPVVPEHHVFFGAVVDFLNILFRGNAFAFTLFTAVMLFAQAIYLNALFVTDKLLDKPNYVVAYLYIALTSILPSFNYFNEQLLVNWCMIGSIGIALGIHHHSLPRKHIFNAGFLIGLSTLIHFQAIAFVFVILIALLFLRTFNIAEWLVAVMGIVTPVYMYACVLFLVDKFPELSYWPQIGVSLPRHIANPGYLIGTLISILVLFACGAYAVQDNLYKAGIYNRRMWTTVYVYLFLSILAAIGTDISEKSVWLMAIPALSMIIAPALIIEKTKWFSNFAFYFSLLLIIYCQWLVN